MDLCLTLNMYVYFLIQALYIYFILFHIILEVYGLTI